MKNRNLDHKDHWSTPTSFKLLIEKEFGLFFDPCPFMHDMSWDGLAVEWGLVNFCNPPYSRVLKEKFVKKGISEAKKGKTCIFLLPVSTSTKLFHEHILPNKKEIRFIKGRLKFSGYNSKGEFVNNKSGMHDSMIVIF